MTGKGKFTYSNGDVYVGDFVDGKLSVQLTQAAYVVVKDGQNNIYWSPTYVGSGNTATFYKGDKADKLHVPGGKLTFTLYHGDNGSLVLYYDLQNLLSFEITGDTVFSFSFRLY